VLVCQDLLDLKGPKVFLDQLVLVLKDQQDHKDLAEIQEHQDLVGHQDL
jgi:hypothetical protein